MTKAELFNHPFPGTTKTSDSQSLSFSNRSAGPVPADGAIDCYAPRANPYRLMNGSE
jgi:hypothetical protein